MESYRGGAEKVDAGRSRRTKSRHNPTEGRDQKPFHILRPPINRSLSRQGRRDPPSEAGREYLVKLGFKARLSRPHRNSVNL